MRLYRVQSKVDSPTRDCQDHQARSCAFFGTSSNDGYPKDDHVLVTDPFEKHVTRTMDALKKSVERAGCTMDRSSIFNKKR